MSEQEDDGTLWQDLIDEAESLLGLFDRQELRHQYGHDPDRQWLIEQKHREMNQHDTSPSANDDEDSE